jgi:hypothetical protein
MSHEAPLGVDLDVQLLHLVAAEAKVQGKVLGSWVGAEVAMGPYSRVRKSQGGQIRRSLTVNLCHFP